MADESAQESTTYRIRRRAGGAFAVVREALREKRWLRWLLYLFIAGLLALTILYIAVVRSLPTGESLLDYETPLPSMVRGIDGEIVDSYARDQRVQLSYAEFPRPLINAFLAAEDKTFFSHGGIDLTGTAGAVIDYLNPSRDGRAVGGSTITQQVAKNILLSDEYSVTRKLKEMVVARRIEAVLDKEEILTLYLNEIPLGRRSFGVQAAARAYFDKDVGDLELHEAAFLSILPKAPERYGRKANEELAITRRNFVLNQMVANEFIDSATAEAAKAMPLGLKDQRPAARKADAGYFLEEVRRQLLERYGEKAEDSPNSVYAGGLWVRTSLDMEFQDASRKALRAGLQRYHAGRGWTGPVATLDASEGNLTGQLASANIGISYEDWRIGVVTERSGNNATIGFSDGTTAPLVGLPSAIAVGDVTAVAPSGSNWAVRTVPEISGGFVAQDPQTGRVLALQGGFDARLGSFNRATQAERQPGSTIKPFVYATGLDNGLTPASMIPDQRFCVWQSRTLGQKCFTNFGGSAGGGTYPMRYGLEQSKNLMTVHIASEATMPRVIKTFEQVGIGSYDPYFAFALGAGDTTVMKMVNAYAALANNGYQSAPTLIDYVQDRRGKVIWKADKRECEGCNMAEWDGKPMPRLGQRGKRVMDPRTAYQTVHMLEGVVERGTATALNDLGVPLFGKTGTSTGPTNVWFVGGSQDVVAGVYLGFDQPRNMGGYAQGGTLAVPIFRQFVTETKDRWSAEPFVAPAGVRLVRVDRRTGKRVYGGWPGEEAADTSVIWEAFKPDTEPERQTRQDRIAAKRAEILAQIRRASRAAGEIRSRRGPSRPAVRRPAPSTSSGSGASSGSEGSNSPAPGIPATSAPAPLPTPRPAPSPAQPAGT